MNEDEPQTTSIPGLTNGQLCYLQIPALDIATSARFYEQIFGWSVDPPESVTSGAIFAMRHGKSAPTGT